MIEDLLGIKIVVDPAVPLDTGFAFTAREAADGRLSVEPGSVVKIKFNIVPTTISFETTKEEEVLIEKILERAKQSLDIRDAQELSMDLEACHANGNPLDFQRLLDAKPDTFGHDIYGIQRHINRRTGKLENLFQPRCSKPVDQRV